MKIRKGAVMNRKERFEKSVLEGEVLFNIGGRDLVLRKWALRKSLKFSSKVLSIIQDILKGFPKDITSFFGEKMEEKLSSLLELLMEVEIDKVFTTHADAFIEVLSGSLEGAEMTLDQSLVFVDSLDLASAVLLMVEIIKLNFTPMTESLKRLGQEVGKKAEKKKSTLSK